jgi:hypothetical protein
MKKLYTITLFLLVACAFFIIPQETKAQNGYILHGFRDVSQSTFLNPAFAPGATTVVGIPLISNISVSSFSSGGGINDFFTTQPGSDSLYLDLDKIISNNQPQDQITEAVNMDVLFAGFKAGGSFISLGVRQRIFVQTILDRDLLRLFWNGNTVGDNEMFDMNHTSVFAYHLLDYHLGASIPVGEKVRIGARFHLLQGLAGISTQNNGIGLKTSLNNQGNLEIHARTNFILNTAGLPDSTGFDVGQYIQNFGNIGYSLDLGLDIQVSSRLSINASFVDWGKLFYRKNTKTFVPTTDSVNFNGVSVDLNNSDPFDGIGDTLQKVFDVNQEHRNFNVKLPGRVMVGLEYFSADYRNDLSVLFSGRFYNNYFEPAVSVGYTRFVSSHFSVKAAYTWIKDAPINIGLAMTVNVSPFQFFVYTDNVTGLFQWDQQKYVQAGFGLNIRIAPRNTRKNPHNPRAIRNLRPDMPVSTVPVTKTVEEPPTK